MKEKNKDLEWILDRNESDKLTGTKVKTKRTSNLLKKSVIIGGVLFSLVLGGLTGCANTNDNNIVELNIEQATYEYAPGFTNDYNSLEEIRSSRAVPTFEEYIIVDSQSGESEIILTGRRSTVYEDDNYTVFKIGTIYDENGVPNFLFQSYDNDIRYDYIHDEPIDERYVYKMGVQDIFMASELSDEIVSTFKFIDKTLIIDLQSFRNYEDYKYDLYVNKNEEAAFLAPENSTKVNEFELDLDKKQPEPQSNQKEKEPNKIKYDVDEFDYLKETLIYAEYEKEDILSDILSNSSHAERLETLLSTNGDTHIWGNGDTLFVGLPLHDYDDKNIENYGIIAHEREGEIILSVLHIPIEERGKNVMLNGSYYDEIHYQHYDFENVSRGNYEQFFSEHKELLKLAVFSEGEEGMNVIFSIEMFEAYEEFLNGRIEKMPERINKNQKTNNHFVKIKTLL